MKLLFSEAQPDYGHYIFPYAVWAFPEPGETPADLLNHGFLPSSRNLDRFYLCRHVRVNLGRFKPSSENRRILRKGEGIAATLVPRAEFDYDPARRRFFKNYADIKFGKDVMSYDRLDSLFSSNITSHLLIFTDTRTGADVGVVTLCLEPGAMAYYYYAFYDTQFAGAEFFNGVRWSANLDELKFLIRREQNHLRQHLLENEDYRRLFYEADLPQIAAGSLFRVQFKNLTTGS